MAENGRGGMRSKVLQELRPFHANAIENVAGLGTPDVEFCFGWIELKFLERYKRNCDISPVLIPHFTTDQRRFLKKRWLTNESSYLLLQIGNQWLLFTGAVAAEYVGRATRPQLLELSTSSWENGFRRGELRECLATLWRNSTDSNLSKFLRFSSSSDDEQE